MAITAQVFINGEIGNTGHDVYLYSLESVRGQLEWAGQFDEVKVTINSPGGDVTEGLAIYDFLSHLRKQGKPITTEAIGQCCSIATIIFLAGDTRLMHENATFMVHQPACGAWGRAQEMQEVADLLQGYTDKLRTIYTTRTGLTDEEVTAMMATDTYLTAQECVEKGFATGIVTPAKAIAYATKPLESVPTKTNPFDMAKETKTAVERGLNFIMALVKGEKPKALKVSLDSGNTIEIDTTGDQIAPGNPAKDADGNVLADGTYTTSDGMVIEVKDGMVSNVTEKEAEAEGSTEPEANADEQVDMVPKAELDKVVAEFTAFKKQVTAVLALKESADVDVTPKNGTPTIVAKTKTVQTEPLNAVERARARKESSK